MNVFQGTKRAKEQEQLIAGQQERLEQLDQAFERIAGTSGAAINILETIEQERDRFDKALTPVVGHIRQIPVQVRTSGTHQRHGRLVCHQLKLYISGLRGGKRYVVVLPAVVLFLLSYRTVHLFYCI